MNVQDNQSQTEQRLAPVDLVLKGRTKLAYELRNQGLSYKEIAEKIGISAGGACQLCLGAKRRLSYGPHWTDGLSVRCYNALNAMKIHGRDEAMEAYLSGRLDPSRGPRNFGYQSYKEIAKWLGFPEPMQHQRKRRMCQHCGAIC